MSVGGEGKGAGLNMTPDSARPAPSKSAQAFRTISEVAEALDLPQHVLRFWETKFSQLRPLKRGGNRRYYRPEDIVLLRAVKAMLYDEGLTIKGVQKRFREQGAKAVIAEIAGSDSTAPDIPSAAPGQGAALKGKGRSKPAPSGVPSQALHMLLSDLKQLRRMLG